MLIADCGGASAHNRAICARPLTRSTLLTDARNRQGGALPLAQKDELTIAVTADGIQVSA